nr:DUF5597 domain-containing protein [uncultured Marvinbryantia sp.]
MFQKEGLKFFSIGGQVNNSSSRDKNSIDRGFLAIQQYQMNTAAFPIYWSRLEPEENVFDYSQTDYIIDQAHNRGLKLVLLWFGTWKNGASHYAPSWVKRDRRRFPRVMDALDNESMVLSPFSEEACKADAKAFSQLLLHIREYDQNHCVIAVQVENEPGIHASPRDYSEQAEALFRANVPEILSSFVFEQKDAALTAIWKKSGAVTNGNWSQFFGIDAEEIFSAFYFARYIQTVAASGKAVFDIPLYVNVWVRETQNRIQGVDFPCGGATSITLGIWKRFAPAIDCLCPDIYFDDRDTYMTVCDIYCRPDNPLYIPESHADEINALRVFEAIERYHLTGIHAFAIDATLNEQGQLTESGAAYKRATDILSSVRPLLERYHRTGKIHAVVQQEYADSMFFDFENWYGRVYFLNRISDEAYIHLDNCHEEEKYLSYRGKGLIINAEDNVFYLAGEGFKLVLFPKKSATQLSSVLRGTKGLNANNAPYLSVEEGHFDESGDFVPERERTGDESDMGLWVSSDIGVVRVVLDV